MTEWTLENHLDTMREVGAYRPMRLHALVLEERDEFGVRTGTMAGLRRALAAKDEDRCLESEVETAVHHLVIAGVLEDGSTPQKLILTGTGGWRADFTDDRGQEVAE